MIFFSKKNKDMGEDISTLKTGTSIEFSETILSSGKETKNVYTSKLEEFIAQDKLLTLIPSSNGTIVKLPTKKVFTIIFKSDKGLFKNTAHIESYVKKDSDIFAKVKLLDKNKKIQRRECYRLEVKLEFKFDKVSEVSRDYMSLEFPVFSIGITQDISNGGMKFISNEELIKEDAIKMDFIVGGKQISSIGVILFAEELQLNEKNSFKYCYKVRFDILSDIDREYITKYIFEEQRKTLQKVKVR